MVNTTYEHSGPIAKAFARRLRDWRTAQRLPLKHVARELGVSISIVSEWEHAHRFPSMLNLEALARLLEMPVCCLLYHGHGHCPRKHTLPTKRKTAGRA
jgi:transcriptional regulator with XRE-family HTH domain